ncbi:MAG: MFS transporter [Actinomycetota bacterium]|nr:MFS transporter [Actinomycetota bacterium]
MLTTHPRVAVTVIYFLNGAVFSSWYARLPAIQEHLGLSEGAIGLALLGAPLGLLVAQPLIGAVIARRGSRSVVTAAPLYLSAVVLPALAVDGPTLLLAVIVVGAANGTLDVAINVQGLAVEDAVRRALFNSLHAAFSFGALAGATLASAAASAGVPPIPHLACAAVAGAACAAAMSRSLLPDETRADTAAPLFVRPSRPLAALGVVAFCALLSEGAVFDWSGIYLARVVEAREGVAALGLAAFSLTMGVGRLLGDGVATRLGSKTPVLGGAIIAGSGLTLTLGLPSPIWAIAGFAVMGLGLSVVFPLTLRAAGSRDHSSGPAIAAVSTFGYTGFLLGPPVIGLLAQATGLRVALLIVVCACAAIAGLSGKLPSRSD